MSIIVEDIDINVMYKQMYIYMYVIYTYIIIILFWHKYEMHVYIWRMVQKKQSELPFFFRRKAILDEALEPRFSFTGAPGGPLRQVRFGGGELWVSMMK